MIKRRLRPVAQRNKLKSNFKGYLRPSCVAVVGLKGLSIYYGVRRLAAWRNWVVPSCLMRSRRSTSHAR